MQIYIYLRNLNFSMYYEVCSIHKIIIVFTNIRNVFPV